MPGLSQAHIKDSRHISDTPMVPGSRQKPLDFSLAVSCVYNVVGNDSGESWPGLLKGSHDSDHFRRLQAGPVEIFQSLNWFLQGR